MLNKLSSAKPINNNLSIGFANDNFSLKKQFLLKTKTLSSPQHASSLFLPKQPSLLLEAKNPFQVESKQTQEDSSSSGFGFNVGVGVGSGGGGSVGAGFNMNNSEMTRTWTDNITTLTATGSMQVNTGLNIGLISGGSGSSILGGSESLHSTTMGANLNLTGAAILSDNMTLNVAGNINKTNLEDKYYSESMSAGVQANVGIGGSANGNANGNNGTGSGTNNGVGSGAKGTGQSPAKTAPSGSASISGSYSEIACFCCLRKRF